MGLLDRAARHLRLSPLWCAVFAAAALSCVGLMAIETAAPVYAATQLRWMLISWIVAGLCVLPHPRWVGVAAYPLALLTLALLVVVLLPFVPRSVVPVRNGATCWIDLRFMMLQPSEVAKVVFVLALARYLRFRSSYRTVRGLLVPFALLTVPLALIVKEPDLGTALIFVPALFVMLVAAGARLGHLGTLVGLSVVLVAANVAAVYLLPESMQVLKPHQRQRIVAMISQASGDNRYAEDIGYQQEKAMTLIGAGRLSGYGAQRSATIVKFNRLPEDHNDMIFAVIVNRWGLLGGLATLGLYLAVFVCFLLVAGLLKDPFTQLATIGFTGLLATQAAMNIGMTLGLLPITGITLPFISYGGSSLVVCFAMLGLVINFASRRPAIISRPTFEFDRAQAALD
jgi:cell division protein FtsW (lipid II flippase)